MVDHSPFSREWYQSKPARLGRIVPDWFANDRRASAFFVLLLVAATVLFSR